MVVDNFYTCPNHAHKLYVLTDGKCKVLGTVALNNINAVSICAVKEAVEALKSARRDECRSCQVLNIGQLAKERWVR